MSTKLNDKRQRLTLNDASQTSRAIRIKRKVKQIFLGALPKVKERCARDETSQGNSVTNIFIKTSFQLNNLPNTQPRNL